jgi:hypothetical protein
MKTTPNFSPDGMSGMVSASHTSIGRGYTPDCFDEVTTVIFSCHSFAAAPASTSDDEPHGHDDGLVHSHNWAVSR